MAPWTDAETFTLVELWDDEAIQDQPEGCKKNSQVFSKISEGMRKEGHSFAVNQKINHS